MEGHFSLLFLRWFRISRFDLWLYLITCQVRGRDFESVEYDQMKDMKLLDSCFKETLRLQPPIYVIMRQSRKPMVSFLSLCMPVCCSCLYRKRSNISSFSVLKSQLKQEDKQGILSQTWFCISIVAVKYTVTFWTNNNYENVSIGNLTCLWGHNSTHVEKTGYSEQITRALLRLATESPCLCLTPETVSLFLVSFRSTVLFGCAAINIAPTATGIEGTYRTLTVILFWVGVNNSLKILPLQAGEKIYQV